MGGAGWINTRGMAVWAVLALALSLSAASPAIAWDGLKFRVPGGSDELRDALRAASALVDLRGAKKPAAQDVLAAARADYARILAALYAGGHYSGVIHIRLDGREVADIPPLESPASVRQVEVIVEPGPRFSLGTASVAPLAPKTVLPETFRTGAPAYSGVILEATQAAVDGWRDRSHAKAEVVAQDVVADHAAARLDVAVTVDPGPALRFGPLHIVGAQRMREERIRAIAGYPEGSQFSPRVLARVTDRLRRTGVFASVSVAEDEAITPPDRIGITAALAEQKPRRYSLGGELSSLDGALLRGSWMHRNLFGGAERLTLSGEMRQIGAQSSGTDYLIGVSLERPATLRADTTAAIDLSFGRLDERDYRSDFTSLGLHFTNWVTERATWTIGLDYQTARVTDDVGTITYRSLSLPLGLTYDDRDNRLDPRKGRYLKAEVRPFLGFDTTGSGIRSTADVRLYRSFGSGDRMTLAGRLQAGAVTGSSLIDTPREFLFFSGGGGTVRGQPYQSLGIPMLRGDSDIGGTLFLGASAEIRARFAKGWGGAVFADYGRISVLDLAGSSDWHAGAGVGLRYDTGFGPVRLDVAAPIGGRTGKGVQVYVGIGQAF